jgi:hypothetical protein
MHDEESTLRMQEDQTLNKKRMFVKQKIAPHSRFIWESLASNGAAFFLVYFVPAHPSALRSINRRIILSFDPEEILIDYLVQASRMD